MRKELFKYVIAIYDASPQYLWDKFPHYAVLRHPSEGKWFALIMDVSKDKLGLEGSQTVDVIDVKCPPEKIGSLRQHKGFLPAYHMNKEHWISILLDGSVPLEDIKPLIDESHELTR